MGKDFSLEKDRMHEYNANRYMSTLQIYPQLNSLHLTLEMNALMNVEDMQQAVIQNLTCYQLTHA